MMRLGQVLIGLFVLFYPLRAQRLYNTGKAQTLEQAGQLEEAFFAYQSSLESNPADRVALFGFIRVGRQIGRFDSLVAVLERLGGGQENADYALGTIEGLLGLKRRGEALSRARRFAERFPEKVGELARVLQSGGEPGVAAGYLETVMRTGGFRADYAERLVELYEVQKRFGAAAEKIVMLVNADPRRLGGFYDRLLDYGRRKMVREVAAELEKIAEPRQRARALAMLYLGAGDEEMAVQRVKGVLVGEELNVFARDCERRGAYRAALLIYQFQSAYADAARILRQMGRVSEARAVLVRDSSPVGRFELAELLRVAERNYPAAADLYREVLKKRGPDEAVLFGLAAALLGERKLDSARQVIAQTANPSDRLLLLKAKVLFYQGKFDSVAQVLQEMSQQFPASLLLNDGLALGVLSLQGEGVKELGLAMLDCDAGEKERGLQRAKKLLSGQGVVAQEAFLLSAQILLEIGKAKEALAVLDTFWGRFPKGELAPRARLLQAEVYRQGLKDESGFRAALERLILEHPGSPYVPIARNLLRGVVVEIGPGEVR